MMMLCGGGVVEQDGEEDDEKDEAGFVGQWAREERIGEEEDEWRMGRGGCTCIES